MSSQNTLAVWVDFAMKNRVHSSALEAEIKTADTSKKRCETHFWPRAGGMLQVVYGRSLAASSGFGNKI
jgi:hypothetical protein